MEPPTKLDPIIKLIGRLTVLFIIKSTLLLLELFCIPIINNKNKQELKVKFKIIFLSIRDIYLVLFKFLL